MANKKLILSVLSLCLCTGASLMFAAHPKPTSLWEEATGPLRYTFERADLDEKIADTMEIVKDLRLLKDAIDFHATLSNPMFFGMDQIAQHHASMATAYLKMRDDYRKNLKDHPVAKKYLE